MKREALIYNSAALNVPKNVMQFIFGVLLFTMAGGNYNVLTCIMAASGLGIGLGAIYLFNDLTDVKKIRTMKDLWKSNHEYKCGPR